MRVMVTGAGALLGQGIIRSLKMSALRPEVVAVDPSRLAVGLRWADRAHLIPTAGDARYLDRIRELLQQERPDVLLIGTDVELPIIAEWRTTLERDFGTNVLVSDPRVIAIANDKWLTYCFLKQHGFPCPASCLPGDEERLAEQVGFPLIVKPRVGARSVGVELVTDMRQLRRAVAARPDAVIQEDVGSPRSEYTAGVLYFDGQEPISVVMRRDLRDGNTYRAYVDSYPELNTFVRQVAVALRPHGPVNFQFRVDEMTPKIFEINGRFSGTTPMRARVGFNEVEMAIRYLLNGAALTQPHVEQVTFLRYWDEIMVRPRDLPDRAAPDDGPDTGRSPLATNALIN